MKIVEKASLIFDRLLRIVRKRDIYIVVFALLLSHFIYYPVEYFYPWTGEPSHNWIYKLVNGLTRGTIIIAYAYLTYRIIWPANYDFFEKSKWREHFEKQPWTYRNNFSFVLYSFFILVYVLSVAIG